MNRDEFEQYLKQRYEKEIAWYDQKSNRSLNAYRIFQWSAVVLSAITPILILISSDQTRLVAVSTAVVVAISTTALKTFRYQENWIRYRMTCETLRKEIHFYNAGIQGYQNTQDKEAFFIDRVESLISRENTLWVASQKKKEAAKSDLENRSSK